MKKRRAIACRAPVRGEGYLLLLPVVFFSPPWAERLLLAPPAALALPPEPFESAAGDDLVEEGEDEPEDFLLDAMWMLLVVTAGPRYCEPASTIARRWVRDVVQFG